MWYEAGVGEPPLGVSESQDLELKFRAYFVAELTIGQAARKSLLKSVETLEAHYRKEDRMRVSGAILGKGDDLP